MGSAMRSSLIEALCALNWSGVSFVVSNDGSDALGSSAARAHIVSSESWSGIQ